MSWERGGRERFLFVSRREFLKASVQRDSFKLGGNIERISNKMM
jgi:hypothetical protein